MNVQQMMALAIVGGAILYLARYYTQALRAFLSDKGGCASGCGKCAFAPKERMAGSAEKRANLIPLSDIRSLPGKRP